MGSKRRALRDSSIYGSSSSSRFVMNRLNNSDARTHRPSGTVQSVSNSLRYYYYYYYGTPYLTCGRGMHATGQPTYAAMQSTVTSNKNNINYSVHVSMRLCGISTKLTLL